MGVERKVQFKRYGVSWKVNVTYWKGVKMGVKPEFFNRTICKTFHRQHVSKSGHIIGQKLRNDFAPSVDTKTN